MIQEQAGLTESPAPVRSRLSLHHRQQRRDVAVHRQEPSLDSEEASVLLVLYAPIHWFGAARVSREANCIQPQAEKAFVMFDRRDSLPLGLLASSKCATCGQGSWAMLAIGRSQTPT